MPTIIDSLVLELGFDTTNMERGRGVVIDTFKKTQEGAKKAGGEVDDSAKKAGEYITRLRDNLLGLYAVFTAGRGLKDFVRDATDSDAALGRFALTVDQSAESIAQWRDAGRLMGVSAQDIDSTFAQLSSQFQNFSITGESTLVPWLRALNVSMSDAQGHMKPLGDFLLELSRKFQGMDPAKATAFMQNMGFSPGMINLMLRGPAAIQQLIDKQKELARVQAQDTAAAAARQQAWEQFKSNLDVIGLTILHQLTPALVTLTNMLNELAKWGQQHPQAMTAAFLALTAAVTLLSGAMLVGFVGRSLISAIAGVRAFNTVMLALGRGTFGIVGGALTILRDLFSGLALRIGVLVVDVFPALGEAFAALSVAIEATPVGWILIAIAGIAVAGYELYKNWDSVSKWWHSLWGGMGDDAQKGSQKVQDAAAKMEHQRSGKAPAPTGPQAQQDIAAFEKMGWTRAQAEGIVANIQEESGGRSNAVGDNGAAYGLGQWHWDRQAAFEGWAGHSIKTSTRSEQLAFYNYELHSSERRAGDALKNAQTAAQAADIVSRLYERPANVEGASARRQHLADQYAQADKAAAPAPGLALDVNVAAPAAPQFPTAGQLATIAAPGPKEAPVSKTQTNSSEVNIGSMTIETKATDPGGIARDFRAALQQDAMVQQANAGFQ